MSAFGWYVVILTVAYVIYYGFMLAWDQYGVKGQNKNVVEEFDGLDGESGKTRVVSESEDGGYKIEEESAPDLMNDEEDYGHTVVIDEPEPSGGEEPGEGAGEESAGDAPESVTDEAPAEEEDDFSADDDDGAMNRLLSIQEGLQKVLVRYDEEYDSSEMKVLMQQRPEYETRIQRIQLRH